MVDQQRQKLMTRDRPRPKPTARRRPTHLPRPTAPTGEAAQTLRAAQSVVADEREGRARAEAHAGRRACAAQRGGAQDPRHAGLCARGLPGARRDPADQRLPALDDADSQLLRLKADRERLGGVNLQADDDLTGLTRPVRRHEQGEGRRGVGHRQAARRHRRHQPRGREPPEGRLRAVDGHFRSLFTALFGGGQAELRLTESEDPLDAGLEIYASPPGKTPRPALPDVRRRTGAHRARR